MFGQDEFTVEMVLTEQCAALKKAVETGIDRAREADLAQEYMMSVRFLAIQQFVFLGLQGIEFALKCILKRCRVRFENKHNLAVLFDSAFTKYPYLQGVMQDEFDFWKDTATHIASRARFLHQESRFTEFLKEIDIHNYQVDTRYFFLSDSKKTSDDRIRLLLDSALDPRLLVHLWDKLNVFYLHEFVYRSEQKGRADRLYFRKRRWRHSPYNRSGWAPGDDEARRLTEEIYECASEYLRTGKAKDFESIESAWVELQLWNEEHDIEDSVWTAYKKKRKGSPE